MIPVLLKVPVSGKGFSQVMVTRPCQRRLRRSWEKQPITSSCLDKRSGKEEITARLYTDLSYPHKYSFRGIYESHNDNTVMSKQLCIVYP